MHKSGLKEDACPLSGAKASIKFPDWSGGRLHVDCLECGSFETNFPTIEAYRILGENKQHTLESLRYQIQQSTELMHITKNKYQAVTIELSKPLTKNQKKHRRKATETVGPALFRVESEITPKKEERDDH